MEKKFSRLIDHTNLSPFASKDDIKKLCEEAIKYNFKMVAINQYYTEYAKSILKDTNVNVGAAIAFPLGQTTIEAKVYETKDAIESGADEIDYVINIAKLHEGDYDYIEREMQEIVDICRENKVISKVIFEICYLNDDQIIELSKIAKKVEPDFIKTSTGFGTNGATVDAVKLMKETVGPKVKVKAAGGIRDYETFKDMYHAGAERIGTSSGIKIVESID